MRQSDAHRALLSMNRAVLNTREAAALWQTRMQTASRRLRGLEEAGFVRRLRRGLWTLDPQIDPFVVAPFLTAPLPAYVSFVSALGHHGMIEQIPKQITVATLHRPRKVETSVGTFSIHRLAPELFGGFDGSVEDGYIARPEKALFDSVYTRAAAGRQAFFPELTLPAEFDDDALQDWVDRIPAKRLNTLVPRYLREAMSHAVRERT
ncbi:MAG: type IV toxin-antitoxin system AbiEi family antitoxin domain-containing protein [Solirubrobacterales bacterium]